MGQEKIITVDHLVCEDEKITFQFKDSNSVKIIGIEKNMKIRWTFDTDLIDSKIIIDLTRFIKEYYQAASRWDLYLETDGSTYRIQIRGEGGGYFNSIPSLGVHVVTPYITTEGGLSIVIKQPTHLSDEKLSAKVSLQSLKFNGPILTGTMLLEMKESYEIVGLVLKHRDVSDDKQYICPVQGKSKLSFEINVKTFNWRPFYYDFYLLVIVAGKEHYVRLKNPTWLTWKKLDRRLYGMSYTFDNGFWIYPYMTASGTLALTFKEKSKYESNVYFFKEVLASWVYNALRPYFNKRNIWLIYEKTAERAQDNGYYFFKYIYENQKHQQAYYIIKPESEDYLKLAGMNNRVLEFMSFKYMVYMYSAQLFVSSETKGHAYDIRIQKGRIRKAMNYKPLVFLQHGVIGLKKLNSIFKKSSINAPSLFVVSSPAEGKIIRNHFGYNDKEIIVSGLPRWDVINNKAAGNSILMMPTWRVWLENLSYEEVANSEYVQAFKAFLDSSELHKLLEQHELTLYFYLHPKFKDFIDHFEINHNRVVISNEQSLNSLMMESSMLITDYSSVSWDMFYQKKPIIFYQFDLDTYNKYQGSYMDFDNELFGDQVFTTEDLIATIKEYAEANFKEKQLFNHLRKTYLPYIDKSNSQRIYNEIQSKQGLLKTIKRKQLLSRVLSNHGIRFLWGKLKSVKTVKRVGERIRLKIK
ncbi:CDP-glycerol glycerophosphotransferase family protein [Peribacillus butanolivorans]|uniref:CDP-glycerol glycerophosphotransferase family protein n=1 Tax=Peribacillus butanolivorans TaxID=421767 RepID=UPI003695CCE9